ncbi:hypothetical protein SS50377_25746 [Spironucleus salmonicida]|nr:hypothetical protein SS50377_25746 [Spironucleus salmonicida]
MLYFSRKLQEIGRILEGSQKQNLQQTHQQRVLEISEESTQPECKVIFEQIPEPISKSLKEASKLKIIVNSNNQTEIDLLTFENSCKALMKGLQCKNSKKKAVFLVIQVLNQITISQRKGCGQTTGIVITDIKQGETKKENYSVQITTINGKKDVYYAKETEILRVITTFQVVKRGLDRGFNFSEYQ